VRKLLSILPLLIALSACHRDSGRNPDAVRQAVIDHLGKRGDLNLNTMKIEVTNVEYPGSNEAIATVSFTPKGSDGGGMAMKYHLVREGAAWTVKGKASGGDASHGAGMPNPPGAAAPSGDLPPGHPPVDAGKPPAKK
jgi:hypothetical protein